MAEEKKKMNPEELREKNDAIISLQAPNMTPALICLQNEILIQILEELQKRAS